MARRSLSSFMVAIAAATAMMCAVWLPSTHAWAPSSNTLIESRRGGFLILDGRRRRTLAVVRASGSNEEGKEEEDEAAGAGAGSSSSSLDLGAASSVIEAAKKAFGDMDFETELDEETKQLYEDAIAAEFDRSVKDLVAVGDELKGESKESMETLRKAAQANLAEAEASAAQIEQYGDRVKTMTARVKMETDNVAREVETLKALREEIRTDPLLRLSNFREQGVVKQAALAAAVLLFIRGGADGLSAATAVVTAPSAVGGYAQSGLLQVGASLAALAYYLFL
jgi:hypothetical protein